MGREALCVMNPSMRPSLFRSSRNRICFPAYCATCSSHGTATSPKQFPLTAIMLGAQAVHDPAPSAPPEARWLESGWLPQARRKRNHGQAKRRRDGTDRGGDRAEGRRRKLIGVLVRSQNMPDNVMRDMGDRLHKPFPWIHPNRSGGCCLETPGIDGSCWCGSAAFSAIDILVIEIRSDRQSKKPLFANTPAPALCRT